MNFIDFTIVIGLILVINLMSYMMSEYIKDEPDDLDGHSSIKSLIGNCNKNLETTLDSLNKIKKTADVLLSQQADVYKFIQNLNEVTDRLSNTITTLEKSDSINSELIIRLNKELQDLKRPKMGAPEVLKDDFRVKVDSILKPQRIKKSKPQENREKNT